jgi:endonuclease/exonuclease/phosphatase family metal-dependent hydrolase
VNVYVPFLVCVAVLAVCVSRAPAQSTSIRVMAYNVRYASDSGRNAWSDRLPAAIAMLRQTAPDVIGMQEALYRQVKDFTNRLPAYNWIGLGRDGGSRGEFMAVFYRSNRLDPLAFDHFWLSDTPNTIGSTTWGNSNRRMVTWILFRDKSTDRRFYFLNTHFDQKVELARQRSAELVLERARELRDHPVVLVGDFNAAAGSSKVYQALVDKDRFTDTWSVATTRGEEMGTFHGFQGTPRNDQRIDWILTRGSVATLSSEIVTFKLNTQYPSDHFPVIADVVIGE